MKEETLTVGVTDLEDKVIRSGIDPATATIDAVSATTIGAQQVALIRVRGDALDVGDGMEEDDDGS